MEERKVIHDGGGEALRVVYERLCQIVGSESCSNKKHVRQCYSRDASSIPGRLPDIVVQPSTTEEVRQIVLVANETRTPLYTRGSGSGLWGGSIPYKGGIVLDCAGRLNKFLRLDEDTLTCVVQPGLTFGELVLHCARPL